MIDYAKTERAAGLGEHSTQAEEMMETKKSFSSTEIRAYKKYEKVRQSGRYNMFDPRARRATGLTSEIYSFVINNFSELREAAEKAQ